MVASSTITLMTSKIQVTHKDASILLLLSFHIKLSQASVFLANHS